MKIICVLFLVLLTSLHAQTITMKGEAVDKSGTLVYSELHTMDMKPNGELAKIKTKYFSPDKNLIAEISSDFSKDPVIPDTVFQDFRFNEKQELNLDPVNNKITLSITNLKNNETKSKTLTKMPNMVSGQGFHNYIIRNFNTPKSDIKFIVLPKLDYFSFTLVKTGSPIKDAERFELKMSNWLMRKLVKEITVDYHSKNKNLLVFTGLTNVDSANRETQDLKITYSY